MSSGSLKLTITVAMMSNSSLFKRSFFVIDARSDANSPITIPIRIVLTKMSTIANSNSSLSVGKSSLPTKIRAA